MNNFEEVPLLNKYVKGGSSMNFVNPLGRSANDGPTPRACMCPVEGGFAAARNDNDNCIHCGCHCAEGGAYRTGNNVAAVTTWRAS